MRSSKKRSRSNQNRPRSLGNIVNRVFDSSGPEGKVRGTPQQIIEKYQTLARDAQLSNDRVAAENFLQHAEHYTRMLAEAQRELAAEQEARQQQYQQNGNQNGGNQGNSQGGGQGGGNGNGQGGGNQGGGNRDYRERGERYDRNERGDRGDRGETRNEQRAPREDQRQPAAASDVIDFGGDTSGLVDLPESHAPQTAEPASADAPAADTPLFATARKAGGTGQEGDAAPAAEPAETRAAEQPRAPRGSRTPRGDKGPEKGTEKAAERAAPKAPRNTIRREARDVEPGSAPPAAEEAKPRRARAPRKPAAGGADTPEAAE